MKTIISILALVISLSAHAPLGQAQWSGDPLVNTRVCADTGRQTAPAIISDGAGGTIVTWIDARAGTQLTSDIYAQRINASGVVQWATNGVAICTASNDQFSPVITSDGANGAIIAWYDYRNGTANLDIYSQRISAAGVVQWAANGVAICTATSSQFFPQLVSDGAGGAIITWYDYRSGANSDIYSQRINAAGVVQWTANGVAICTASNNQFSPDITSDGANGAIIAWYDYRNGTSNSDIYSQRISATGVAQWTADGVAICTASNHQFSPDIASDGASGAIIVWTDSRSGTANPDIYSQRISVAGAVQWTVNGVAICSAANAQSESQLVSDGANGAIIAWRDSRSGTTTDIYSQRISATGAAQWTANGVAICTGNAPFNPLMTSDGVNGAIIAWYDRRSGVGDDIYSQRISAAGVVQWNVNGVAICSAANDQEFPAIVAEASGGAIIAWYDERSSRFGDIYVQRVNPNGSLGGPTAVDEMDVPRAFTLEQNYPNPFNPSTRIRFSVGSGNGGRGESERVTLKVFDVLSRQVATLVNENLNAGSYEATFDANGLASGTYFYRLQAGEFSSVRRLLLLK